MTQYNNFSFNSSRSPLGFLGPLIILTLVFLGIFFIAKGIFKLFTFLAPVLLIAILILDYKVLLDYIKSIFTYLKTNPLIGIVMSLITFFGFPFVLGYLLFKAIGKRKIKSILEHVEKEKNTYTQYEEVVEEEDNFLDLPPLNKETLKESRKNNYDDTF